MTNVDDILEGIEALQVDTPASMVELTEEQLTDYIRGNRIQAYDIGFDGIDYKLIKEKHIVISGYGNHGKGTLVRQIALQTMILHGFKSAFWAPEDMPAEYFYGDLIHTLTGLSTEKHHENYIGEIDFLENFNAIKNEIFLLDYDKYPDYKPLFADFQRLHDLKGVTLFVVDPFNNLSYDDEMRDDKLVRAYCLAARSFVQANNAILITVVHPKSLTGHKSGSDAPLPTYHDLMYGSEWNKYVDDILFYHHPTFESNANNKTRQLGKRKVKKQKICGKTGIDNMHWDFITNTIYGANGMCELRSITLPTAAENVKNEFRNYYEKQEDIPF